MNALKVRLDHAEQSLSAVEAQRDAVLALLPNPPDASVPDGGEDEGEVVSAWGEPRTFGEGMADHGTLGERLGLWDLARGSKVSGSRFVYLTGPGVLLEQALMRLALDVVLSYGFRPVVPPVLVRERAMYGTGFFPAEKFEYYDVDAGDLYLVGTSEVPLAAFHADEILERLPLRYAGLSSCFRREAGSYGKDTAGIFRVHQFQKLEMFAYVDAAESAREHKRMLAIEEELVQALELPYRVVNIAARELGVPAVKKYDVEAWLPSEGRFREITSCSNCTDFQARRLQVRHRAGAGVELVHTLNGTAATDRWLCFLVEHHQQPDGSIEVPLALQPHVPGGLTAVRPAG